MNKSTGVLLADAFKVELDKWDKRELGKRAKSITGRLNTASFGLPRNLKTASVRAYNAACDANDVEMDRAYDEFYIQGSLAAGKNPQVEPTDPKQLETMQLVISACKEEYHAGLHQLQSALSPAKWSQLERAFQELETLLTEKLEQTKQSAWQEGYMGGALANKGEVMPLR